MGMDKTSKLAKSAFELLVEATKIRDARNDAILGLTNIIKYAKRSKDHNTFRHIEEACAVAEKAGVPVRGRDS